MTRPTSPTRQPRPVTTRTGVLLTAVGAAAAGYVVAVDPGAPDHYPGCPLLALTGWYCPGCGGLRAVHALGHGDLGAAFGFNPLLVALLPFALAACAGWAGTVLGGRPAVAPTERSKLVLGLAGLAVAAGFWVFRNLPAGAWAAP